MVRLLVAAVVFATSMMAAQAQDYPNRLIKIVQGFSPGGNVDIIARIIANQLQKELGQPVVVEAKPGAAGSLAAEAVARSEPDGYTLLVLPSAHAMYGGLARNVKYKVIDDFTWISMASAYPFLICVRKDSPIQTLKQLIDEAHAKPGNLKYGSSGYGTGLHTIIELIASHTQSQFLHVPYRGEGAAITALLTGEIDFVGVTTGTISARVRSGEFRALAVSSKDRWDDLPDVPTAAEAGIPGFEFMSWTGLAGPPHLPPPVLGRLTEAMRRIVAAPDVKTRLEAMGGDARATTPDEMRDVVARQYEIWKKLGKDANLTIN